MKKKKKLPIEELYEYWKDLAKKPELTIVDYKLFLGRTRETLDHFFEYYGWYRGKQVETFRDKFYKEVRGIPPSISNPLVAPEKPGQISSGEYDLMKQVSRGFVPRIKKVFEFKIASTVREKTPLQDAEYILSCSSKTTYKQAAGMVAANYLASSLMKLLKSRQKSDDIMTLYDNLRKKTTCKKLKNFLVRSYRRFEDADKTRNRCAHINEGEPTKIEVEQLIALSRLLQKHF